MLRRHFLFASLTALAGCDVVRFLFGRGPVRQIAELPWIQDGKYTLSAVDHLKHLVWTGSGTLVLNKPATLPPGFRTLS